ncbi:MAG: DUF2851 family protein [Bacteroidales bacterium]|nr:DUF2851 family protein [Bacteroidales bacterium]
MSEDFLQFLWQYRLFDENNLCTSNGEKIEIIHVGTKNSDAGPDFFNSRIRYAGIEWAGNVEIHKNSSDWNIHQHNIDEAYDNVILHVVWNYDQDVFNSKHQKILTITLPILPETMQEYKSLYENHKPIACSDKLSRLNYPFATYLETLAVSKLEKKSKLISNELKETQYNWEESFYRILAYSFGLKANAHAFLMLAQTTPLTIIKKNLDQYFRIEALMFGQSGLLPQQSDHPYVAKLIKEYAYLQHKYNLVPLNASVWKFSKIHPPSFPTIRIAQWVYFLHKHANDLMNLIKEVPFKKLVKQFQIKTSEFWDTHYTFEKETEVPVRNRMGKSFIHLIFINSVLPFIFIYAKEKQNTSLQEWVINIFEQIPSEKNHIIKFWHEANIIPKNAFQSQALLYLYEQFCKPRFCLRCNIGTYLLLHTKSL